jgi:hypothetical protein
MYWLVSVLESDVIFCIYSFLNINNRNIGKQFSSFSSSKKHKYLSFTNLTEWNQDLTTCWPYKIQKIF